MKNLLLSNLFALFISGCAIGHYNQLLPLTDTAVPPAITPLFGNHFNSFLFKTNIALYNKKFSGLLITKQLEPNDYRVIFTTELGMKLFDFEFTDTAFTLHYCVPQFKRPALISTIQKDIEIILMTKLEKRIVPHWADKQNNYLIHQLNDGLYSNYYFYEKKSNRLVKIEHAKRNRKKTTFTMDNYTSGIPASIKIQHHDVTLKIELALLQKQESQ